MRMATNPNKTLVTKSWSIISHRNRCLFVLRSTNSCVSAVATAAGRRFSCLASSSQEAEAHVFDSHPPAPTTPTTTTSSSSSPSPSIINVENLANRMREQVREYTRKMISDPLVYHHHHPHQTVRLVGILAESGPYRADAEIYSDRIHSTLTEDGIAYELCRCSGQSPADVEAVIRHLNQRPDVHGILVFYPIFKSLVQEHIETMMTTTTTTLTTTKSTKGPYLDRSTGVHYKTYDDYLRDIVSPSKDVEGLCSDYNARWLFRARAKNRISATSSTSTTGSSTVLTNQVYIPCTALAVLKILETYHDYTPSPRPPRHSPAAFGNNDDTNNPAGYSCNYYNKTTHKSDKRWSGLQVTIVNRSEILGRPLAALLALEGATVFSVDDHSILRFTESGRMQRCPKTMKLQDCLQQSSVVVTGVPSPDFLLPTSAIAPGTTVVNVSEFSNVDELSLLEQCPNVKLIPNVGKVTVAALEQNLIRLHQQATKESKVVSQ